MAIINIDAKSNNKQNPVVQSFAAGTYEVKVIGVSEGGQYDAWTLWSVEIGCDEKGENCTTGWVNEYNITSNEFSINIPSSGKYATAKQALEKAQNTSFTLTSDSKVNFFINDDELPDNRGGISLAVKKTSPDSVYPKLNFGSLLLLVLVSLTVLVIWIAIGLVTGNPGR
ncbi:hypothetical protein H6S82_03900 [Planktothrix sp. FACHB-1355]|uniref:Uncharacterized protein n=1 Tax=Aerosakkonema funiforme FACHB-1375 TaxID=2949571 RepID=A0A926VD43_9CYAN|nr:MULTISPECIES: hypothetical protein [Oscillatoriales]MBD2181618.1 hypothetical protein [Aerosakkonema funiforme FACHB-1375]MBD3558000.1 hypothetical protein [Planktothrix sp. FACHB-1355]